MQPNTRRQLVAVLARRSSDLMPATRPTLRRVVSELDASDRPVTAPLQRMARADRLARHLAARCCRQEPGQDQPRQEEDQLNSQASRALLTRPLAITATAAAVCTISVAAALASPAQIASRVQRDGTARPARKRKRAGITRRRLMRTKTDPPTAPRRHGRDHGRKCQRRSLPAVGWSTDAPPARCAQPHRGRSRPHIRTASASPAFNLRRTHRMEIS